MSGKVLKNSAIYTFVTLLQRSVGFLLLPFYTYYLTPGEYGNLSVILSISNFVSILFLLAIPYATARFNFSTEDPQKLKVLWGNNLILILMSTLLIGATLIVFHKNLIDPFAKGIDFYPLLLVGILTTILSPLYVFYQSYLQTGQNGKKYGINLTANFILNNCLILIFVIKFKMGIMGILVANFITAIIFAIYTIIVFLPKIKLAFDKVQTQQTLKYSIPLIPHTISFWVINMMDRIFLNNLSNASVTGIYSVGNQVGSTINVVTSSVNQAYSPWFYDIIKDPEKNTVRVTKMTQKLSLLYCLIALAISFFSKEIIQILANEKYLDAWKIIPIIAFGCVFLGYYHFFANVILLEKKTKYLAFVSICTGLISMMMNLWLIPIFNGLGAALATVISYSITSVLAYILARKFRPDIKFQILKMYGMLLLLFGLSFFAYAGFLMKPYLFFSLKVTIYIGVVGFYAIKNQNEIKSLLQSIKAKLSKSKKVELTCQ